MYDCANSAILHLQMHLIGWDVYIVHQNDNYITDTDYWFRLEANFCFHLPFKTYLDLTCKLCLENPPPTYFLIKPKIMPYYRGPQVLSANQDDQHTEDAHYQAIVSTVIVDNSHGLCHLAMSWYNSETLAMHQTAHLTPSSQ